MDSGEMTEGCRMMSWSKRMVISLESSVSRKPSTVGSVYRDDTEPAWQEKEALVRLGREAKDAMDRGGAVTAQLVRVRNDLKVRHPPARRSVAMTPFC
jgi:hypothetical protein